MIQLLVLEEGYELHKGIYIASLSSAFTIKSIVQVLVFLTCTEITDRYTSINVHTKLNEPVEDPLTKFHSLDIDTLEDYLFGLWKSCM